VTETKRKWTGGTRGGRYGNAFYIALVRRGGLAFVPFFQFWTVLYFLIFAGESRRISFDLARRLGRGDSFIKRLSFAYMHLYTFATLLIDRMAIMSGLSDKYEVIRNEQDVHAVVREGQGLLLVTAHIGNWQAMGHYLADMDRPGVLVMYDGIPEKLRATMEDLTKGHSFRVLYTDGSPASAAAILQALKDGEVVGIMGDRVLSGKSLRLPFLDGQADFPIAPYVLAAASGVPIFYTFALRTGKRRYEMKAIGGHTLNYTSRAERSRDIERWTKDYVECLEDTLKRYPYQWGNFFPYFVDAAEERA